MSRPNAQFPGWPAWTETLGLAKLETPAALHAAAGALYELVVVTETHRRVMVAAERGDKEKAALLFVLCGWAPGQ